MPNPNKVEFGISNLHVGTYTVNDQGKGVLGTPYHQAGAVNFAPEESSENNNFYADNIVYWSGYSGGTLEGDIEVAIFDDDFKTQFLGWVTLEGGAIGSVKNPVKPDVYIAFEVEGDKVQRRILILNASLGSITREYHTIEENKEPVTETVPMTAVGDNDTGLTLCVFKPGDTGYDTLFTAPTIPAVTSPV